MVCTPISLLEEVAFFLAGFLVLLTRDCCGLTLRHFCDGNVPPGLVVWDTLHVCRLNNDHRSTGLFPRSAESSFEVFARPRSSGPGSETGSVSHEIDGDDVALVFAVAAMAILRSHTFITAAAAEPANAREAVIVEQNDIQFVIFLNGG